MKELDNEKDIFIKNKLQKDELISKKANDIFEKLNKGEFNMEEKVENVQVKNGNNNKNKKSSKWKKILATAASLVIVIGVANVYATTQGYDNVFFMIKYLITGEKNTEGKDNVLSDRDITISYEPINITKGFTITIKKLQIKDNQAKLFVLTDEKDVLDNNTVPLRFKVYNSENKLLCNQISIRNEQNSGSISDELILSDFKNSYTILNLEIYKANEEKIAKLIIDLNNKTVEVEGEEEALTKISEIELKEFLGLVAGLSETGDASEDEIKIDLACQMLSAKNPQNPQYIIINNLTSYPVSEVDKMLESYLGNYLGDTIKNFKGGKHIKISTKNGNKYYTYATPSDMLYGGECINISNISYCNGLYTIKYTYYYRGPEPDADVNMDSYDIYEQEIGVTLNEDTKYSKFKIALCREPIIVKKAVGNSNNNTEITNHDSTNTTNTANTNNININNNNSNNNNNQTNTTEKIDNYATSMSWTEYWAPGIKFKYPTKFTIEEEGGYNRGDRQGEVSTRISGDAIGINPDTKEIISSNLIIYIYEPKITNEDISKYKYGSNGLERAKFTTNSGIVWYEESKEGKELPHVEAYTHIEPLSNGNNAIYKIEFHTNKRDNYKVTNIINWMLGSTQITSY